MHAERVNETSTEVFILRIFKENKEGFIKAFSDSPESFISSGLSPLQTTLQLLQLQQRKADVAGLYQPLNPSMNEIQQAITKCIEACLMNKKGGWKLENSFRCNNKTTIWNLSESYLVMIAYHLIVFLETIITSQTPTSALSQQQESPWLSLDAVRFLVWRKDVYSFVHQLQILQIIDDQY
ncbi:unnamed protein product [Rhizophagus irregularis]|nr:unnamed protein product [Rhizophagus irregularis]